MKPEIYDLQFAEELILERCQALETETVALASASGRVLASDIREDYNPENKTENQERNESAILVQKGNLIKPILHAVLASQGISGVNVYKKPLIGCFTVRDETCTSDKCKTEMNRHILGNVLKGAEFSSIYQGQVLLDGKNFVDAMHRSSSIYDAVVICAGSEGRCFEQMKILVRESGAEIVVSCLNMEPGMQVCVSFVEHIPVFCLAGEPEDVITALYLTVLPALKKISGRCEEHHDKIMVELQDDFDEYNEHVRILPGRLSFTDGIVRMQINEMSFGTGRGPLREIDAFAVVPEGRGPLKKGTLLNAYRIVR